jgi:hypothetical protein
MANNARSETRTVYAITERGEKSYWTRVGVAFENRDRSINVQLDALPVSGRLQIRDDEPRGNGDRR